MLPATATFTVSAVGANLGYQWQKNRVDIPGADSPSYTTPATTLWDIGSMYRCIVSNDRGSAISKPGILNPDASPFGEAMEEEAARAEAAAAVFAAGGVWEYTHQGRTYQRHFLPDGKAHLYSDSQRSGAWNGFTWRVQGSRLVVNRPDGTSEGHHLDDEGRLVLPAGLGTARKIR